jgi:hypothetical protein
MILSFRYIFTKSGLNLIKIITQNPNNHKKMGNECMKSKQKSLVI